MTPPKKIIVRKIRFLAEQDGVSERVLKDKLSELFGSIGEIDRAYLARVDLGSGPSVALALRAHEGNQEVMANRIGPIFSKIFASREHLDILFISAEQEVSLKNVCNPFFASELGGVN